MSPSCASTVKFKEKEKLQTHKHTVAAASPVLHCCLRPARQVLIVNMQLLVGASALLRRHSHVKALHKMTQQQAILAVQETGKPSAARLPLQDA